MLFSLPSKDNMIFYFEFPQACVFGYFHLCMLQSEHLFTSTSFVRDYRHDLTQKHKAGLSLSARVLQAKWPWFSLSNLASGILGPFQQNRVYKGITNSGQSAACHSTLPAATAINHFKAQQKGIPPCIKDIPSPLHFFS